MKESEDKRGYVRGWAKYERQIFQAISNEF